MDEREFVNSKRESWDRLAGLIDRAGGRRGIHALNREELLSLGPLYRRVSSDLAYARAQAVSQDLVNHLNGLVGRSHALLYEAETSGNSLRSVSQFYQTDFPLLLQRHARLFAAAMLFMGAGIAYGYWRVRTAPETLSIFVPAGEMRESLEHWKQGTTGNAQAVFSAILMTHNFQVGLVALASGLLAGLPTIYALFSNGVLLGAFAAVMTQVHRHSTFWPGILPHGVAELTAIGVCAAGGFRAGLALLFPGRLLRTDAFRAASLDAVRLAIGSIPLFVFAGIVEGMFSHLPFSPAIRYAFAGANGVLWYAYLFLPRRQAAPASLGPNRAML